MPVAPTPPTKPTPPVVPTLTPASSNTSPDSHTASPANSVQNSSKSVNPAVTGAVKELEGLGRAFQGNSSPTKADEKAEPAAKIPSQTKSIQPASVESLDAQGGVSTQTTVPANPPAIDSKQSSSGYIPFLGIVGVLVLILVVLRLFKNKTKHPVIIDSSKKTTTEINKEDLAVVVPLQTTAPKVKGNFDLRA